MAFQATSVILPIDGQFATSFVAGRWRQTMASTVPNTITQFTTDPVYTVSWSSGMDPGTWTFTAARMDDSTSLVIGSVVTKVVVFTSVVATTSAPPPDTTPPIVTIEEPDPGDVITTGVINVHYTIVENESSIALTQLILTTTDARVSTSGLVWPTLSPINTTSSWNGPLTLSVRAVNSASSAGEATASVTFIIDNPITVVSTPANTLSRRAAIIDRLNDGRIKAVLWAPVPSAAVSQFIGSVSKWNQISSDQAAAIAAGTLRELLIIRNALGMTDDQVHTMLEAEWAAFNDATDDLGIWPLINQYWTGTAWQSSS